MRLILSLLLLFISSTSLCAQPDNRIPFGEEFRWVNGGNIAWINFARDIGPGETRLDLFEEMFAELREHGGDTFRIWLHTNGAHTPEWQGEGYDAVVIGPGEGAIDDLLDILDLAEENGIKLMLCLWSFDMLRISTGPEVTDRNYALLTQEDRLEAYLESALTPMVEALHGHPGILSWEVFNEPEGMSNEFGWEFNRHVPMQDIQRFINRVAGTIKRIAPDEQVTNGSWSFRAASDVTADRDLLLEDRQVDDLTLAELHTVRDSLAQRYDFEFTLEQAAGIYDTLYVWPLNYNYYTDERLIAAGGDPLGVLDYYTVHYYQWAYTLLSPFHHDKDFWELDKPLVIAEFYLDDDTFGVSWDELFVTLHERGYAGALGWQWFDAWANRPGIAHNWPRVLENVRSISGLLEDQ